MTSRRKLQPIDYAVMFGGPIVFLLIFWFGIRGVIGPVPEESPVKRLQDGEVALGTSMKEVELKLGRPGQIHELPDGGFRFVYTRTVYEAATQSDSLDEAVIEFTPTGRVLRIHFDRSAPLAPGTTTTS